MLTFFYIKNNKIKKLPKEANTDLTHMQFLFRGSCSVTFNIRGTERLNGILKKTPLVSDVKNLAPIQTSFEGNLNPFKVIIAKPSYNTDEFITSSQGKSRDYSKS